MTVHPPKAKSTNSTSAKHGARYCVFPPGVYHGVRNVGKDDAWFVNMPSTPYRHEDPDKYRLPLDSPDIPFRFKALGEARLHV